MPQGHGLHVLMLLAAVPFPFPFPFPSADAFLSPHGPRIPPPSPGRHDRAVAWTTSSTSSLFMVSGFGASNKNNNNNNNNNKNSNKNNKKKKGGSTTNTNKKDLHNKLKPRQQWDRYGDLKAFASVRVAVRILILDTNIESLSEPQAPQPQQQWLPVGAVKSKDNAYTEAAVIRHRVLIAEHARRLFPLVISAKDKLEFAYTSRKTATATATETPPPPPQEEEEWIVAGKVEDLPDDIDKLIGFEGLADPTGFYARSTEKLGYRSVADFDNLMKQGTVGHIDFQ
jgi:hypothetical protein